MLKQITFLACLLATTLAGYAPAAVSVSHAAPLAVAHSAPLAVAQAAPLAIAAPTAPLAVAHSAPVAVAHAAPVAVAHAAPSVDYFVSISKYSSPQSEYFRNVSVNGDTNLFFCLFIYFRITLINTFKYHVSCKGNLHV